MSFAAVTLVAIAYGAISIALDPGVSYSLKEEKVLVVRIASMYAVVTAAILMTRIERGRRREAVDAERAQAERSLELQRRALEAELAAAEEIHNGVAQSMYALSLNLETTADMAEREPGPLRERLRKLVTLAKQTLLETRHYIYDLKPLLSGETDLGAVTENHVNEFEMASEVPVELTVEGEPRGVPVPVATGFYRLLQESLANVLKRAQAGKVEVTLAFEQEALREVWESQQRRL